MTTQLVPFTPTAVDADVLQRRTVGRADVLDRLLTAAHAAAAGHERRHSLLVAPRGGGKTHVLSVFANQVRTHPELGQALVVAALPEDAVDVSTYADLLVAVIEQRAESAETQRSHDLRARGATADLEEMLLAQLDGRPLILTLENLDQVFEEIGEAGQAQLRGFVETSGSVMLVASTPALFAAVSTQTQPWFGSFTIETLAPWTLSEGATFLERIARDAGDDELARRLGSPYGRGRLAAIDRLVGGLPRLWTILAGCLTVDLLDELVPLVLATLDQLVPYYRERLRDLPPGERKLVVAVARAEMLGSESDRSVAGLASAAGVSVSSAPKLLRRLEDAAWIRKTKPDGLDKRVTWYELREPLLRYYLEYRERAAQPLSLIVAFLQAWYSQPERLELLTTAAVGAPAEAYLLESLRDAFPGTDDLYSNASPVELLAGARAWLADDETVTGTPVRSGVAAVVAEVAALVALTEADDELARIFEVRLRGLGECRRVAERLARLAIDAARRQRAVSGTTPEMVISAGLEAAHEHAGCASLHDEVAIGLIALGWRGTSGEREAAYSGFSALSARAAALPPSAAPLRLAVDAERAFFGYATGDTDEAFTLMSAVLREREQVLGACHADTLTSRANLAHVAGERGDWLEASALLEAIVKDQARALGADSPATLHARHDHAFAIGAQGDAATARDLLVAVVAARERVLGVDHQLTQISLTSLAYFAGTAGDLALARDRYADLAERLGRTTGADSAETLNARHGHAVYTALTGDSTAISLYRELAVDYRRVAGEDEPDTLQIQRELAWQVGLSGDRAGARDLRAWLIPKHARVLGDDSPTTLSVRQNHAWDTGEAGDRRAAYDLFVALCADRARVLGADDPDTLHSRLCCAYSAARADDPATASGLYAALVPDLRRVRGADHDDTRLAQHAHAHQTGASGQPGAASLLFAQLVDELLKARGPADPKLLSARAHRAFWRAQAGDVAGARAELQTARAAASASEPRDAGLVGVLAAVESTVDLTERLLTGGAPELPAAVVDGLASRVAQPVIEAALRRATDGPTGLSLAGEIVERASVRGALPTISVLILSSAGEKPWQRLAFDAWLDAWLYATRDDGDAGVLQQCLRVLRRERDGEVAARLSLAPELRELLPEIRFED